MKIKLFFLTILILAMFAVVSLSDGIQKSGKVVSISIPKLKTVAGERVIGFEFHLTSGRIATLPDVPIGWNFNVENDPSWNTKIQASFLVGAAALGPSFFNKFLIVEINESLGIPFGITGEVVVSRDQETERRIQIGTTDLKIVKE